MTTIAKSNMADDKVKETEPFTARRTESFDALGVAKLLTTKAESVFGRIVVDDVM